MLGNTQWDTIRDLVGWLDDTNGRDEQEITLRLMKLTEEVGEVSQAWIGVTGQNPRKGVTHTIAAVRDELCDVILTAAVALGSVSDNPAAVLDAAIDRVAARSLDTTKKDAAHCAECSHSRDDHHEGDAPVTPGQCTTCAAQDPDSSWHDYEPAGDA